MQEKGLCCKIEDHRVLNKAKDSRDVGEAKDCECRKKGL